MRSSVAVFDLKRRLSAEALGTGFWLRPWSAPALWRQNSQEETVQSHFFATRFPPVPFFS
jgi:hypothetical protein